ncbi:MAG: Crp/Fnr family transcriptional regulator [Candidatus Sulfotelmatobacter sp.]
MAKRDSISHTKRPLKDRKIEGNGNFLANEILLKLPDRELQELYPKLEFVRLKLHTVLHEAGEQIKSIYFVNTGLQSILSVQPDGKSVEVGLVGKEGFVGIPVIAGFRSSPTRVITQGEGTAYRVDVETLRQILPSLKQLELELHRFAQRLAMQSTQIAACNRLHDVEERLARWLLMSQDRIGSEELPLTQEFLGQMLGTRRSSVSVAASLLQKAGMITYTRGNVTILNRPKLEATACDCYEIIQRQLKTWSAETE